MSECSDAICEPGESANRDAPHGEAWTQSRSDSIFRRRKKSAPWDSLRNYSPRRKHTFSSVRREPWMYALGEPGALKDGYSRAGFLNVWVHAVPIQRRLPSAADAIRSMRNSASDVSELMSRLNDADRELASAEIEQQLRQFEGPNGF